MELWSIDIQLIQLTDNTLIITLWKMSNHRFNITQNIGTKSKQQFYVIRRKYCPLYKGKLINT